MNYDITNWRLIITQLLSNHREISVINRAQLIDDSLNIARVSGLPYATALSLIDYLAKEVEYLPWRSALNGLEYVDLMLSRAEGYHYFKVIPDSSVVCKFPSEKRFLISIRHHQLMCNIWFPFESNCFRNLNFQAFPLWGSWLIRFRERVLIDLLRTVRRIEILLLMVITSHRLMCPI